MSASTFTVNIPQETLTDLRERLARTRWPNAFSQFRATVDGFGIHLILERGKGPNPMPLMLLHGWPSSFWQMLPIIPMLTDPQKYDGQPEASFDVVVPSLPGYGFSDRPTQPGMSVGRIAELFTKLMTDQLAGIGIRGRQSGSGRSQRVWLRDRPPVRSCRRRCQSTNN
jgi:pimeloyl-ACP methyl ester carboxylesterase